MGKQFLQFLGLFTLELRVSEDGGWPIILVERYDYDECDAQQHDPTLRTECKKQVPRIRLFSSGLRGVSETA